MNSFKIVSFIFFTLTSMQTLHMNGSAASSDEGLNKLVTCTSWQCKQKWEQPWKECWKQACEEALKEKKEKFEKEESAASATEALHTQQVTLSKQDEEQVTHSARQLLKDKLWNEWCPHTPCGVRLGIGI